jgi:hypothetical protein
VEDGKITDCGYSGRALIGVTRLRLGRKELSFPAVQYPVLQAEPEVDEPAGWRSVLLRVLLLRRVVVCARQASATGGPAPWRVRFFDLWHPWLNRPLARVAIWLSDWQLRRYREAMEWPDQEDDLASRPGATP